MTEITDTIDGMPEAVRMFILHWGDMGGTWGVNRSVAQIHALLYMSEAPLPAENIASVLGIARSNVSNSLKELLGWKIIRRVPMPADRRDFFAAEVDVWNIAKHIATIRKAQEIDPALATLKACMDSAKSDDRISDVQRQRLQNMLEFTETMDHWYKQILTIPTRTLLRLIKMGDRVVGLLKFIPGQR